MAYKYQTFADLLYASYSRLRFRFGTLNEKRAVYAKSALSNLSEAEERIVALIQSNAQKILSEAIGLTRQYVGRCMDSLQARKVIRRVGPDKGGSWEVFDIRSNRADAARRARGASRSTPRVSRCGGVEKTPRLGVGHRDDR